MYRRTVLSSVGTAFVIAAAGCLDDTRGDDSAGGTSPDNGGEADDGDGDVNVDDDAAQQRALDCEPQYIREEIVTGDDETIEDELDPRVVADDSHADGVSVEVETTFGTVRSAEGEPDEHRDYQVSAIYLVTEGTVYRTEGTDAEGDPRDGVVVGC